MKKFLSLLIGLCACAMLAQADDMDFVTVLSAPVGTFQTLETANPYAAVHAPTTTFGTSRLPDSTIDVTTNSYLPQLGVINLSHDDTTIMGDLKGVSSPKLQMGDGVTLRAKAMVGNQLVLQDENQLSPIVIGPSSSVKREVVRGAKIDRLYFYDGVYGERRSAINGITMPEAANQNHNLLWSNQYQAECRTNSEGEITCQEGIILVTDCKNDFPASTGTISTTTISTATIRPDRCFRKIINTEAYKKQFVLKANLRCLTPPEGLEKPAEQRTCTIENSGRLFAQTRRGKQYRSVIWNSTTCKYDVGVWGICYSDRFRPTDHEIELPNIPAEWLTDHREVGGDLIMQP